MELELQTLMMLSTLLVISIISLKWLIIDFKGGYYDVNNTKQDFILMFDNTLESWSQIGTMKEARSRHATSVIPLDEVLQYATNCSYS